MNAFIFSIVTFVYLAAFVLLLSASLLHRGLADRLGRAMMSAGFILQTCGIALRWVESYHAGFGHAPLSNFYESLVFFSWAVVLFSLVLTRGKGSVINVFALAAAFLLMAYASFSPGVDSRIQPLIPALKSNWLIIHVITCFLGYAALALSSLMGFVFLVKPDGPPGEKETLGEMLYRSLGAGFILFTFGIMTGSVWAHFAWGRYWGWDPKETWALVTWLIYAAVLHVRIREGGVNKRVAVMTLIGLMSILFTYFGVNYLPGLHSYR